MMQIVMYLAYIPMYYSLYSHLFYSTRTCSAAQMTFHSQNDILACNTIIGHVCFLIERFLNKIEGLDHIDI